jgi:hypothetical protein
MVRSWTGWKRLSVNCSSRHDFPTPAEPSNKRRIRLRRADRSNLPGSNRGGNRVSGRTCVADDDVLEEVGVRHLFRRRRRRFCSGSSPGGSGVRVRAGGFARGGRRTWLRVLIWGDLVTQSIGRVRVIDFRPGRPDVLLSFFPEIEMKSWTHMAHRWAADWDGKTDRVYKDCLYNSSKTKNPNSNHTYRE